MNTESLLAHFERIAEAPDAVSRLRRFILDLAVRGKLVEQDPGDEPASELLKRIQAEKARLVKAGTIRRPGLLEANEEGSELFQIPVAWTWCRLAEVGAIVGGGTPPSTDSENFAPGGSGIAWLTPTDLGKRTDPYVSHGARDLTPKGLRSSSATLMPKGAVLFTSRAPIGYTAIAANEVSTNQGFKSVVPFVQACNLYIAVYFRAFGKWIDGKASGTTFREVSGKIVANLLFPLPPLAEQQRVVAKVDELMALCDRLEAAQAERESRRDRLVAASLHRLNNGADAESFREHARFHLYHLPRLTTRLEHIQQFRQTILALAVRGRLVPQDCTDEPASILLDRLKADAEAYCRGKGVAPPLAELTNQEAVPHPAPPGWSWTRLCALCKVITDGDHQPPPKSEDGIAFLTIGNITTGRLDFSNCRFVSKGYLETVADHRRPSHGDILYTVVGATYGRPVFVDTDRQFCVQRHIAILKPTSEIDVKFLCYMLASSLVYEQATLCTTGTAQPTIPLRPLRNFLVLLPPIAEQHRIVAKVDELMALCNRLEAQLTTTTFARHQLLEATIHQAISGQVGL